jgi:biotin synthase-like enzyme
VRRYAYVGPNEIRGWRGRRVARRFMPQSIPINHLGAHLRRSPSRRANSIFYGDKLLTTPNSGQDEDRALLHDAGVVPMA